MRNVLWDKAVRHPLTRFKSDRLERERLGASFQLLAQMLFDVAPVAVKVQVGAPITLEEAGSRELSAIHALVLDRMRLLVQHPPVGEGMLIL